MTTTFDKREEGFEKKFAHDEELKFKAMARRNKMLGLWAAGVLGKSGADAEAYAKDVVMADLEKKGQRVKMPPQRYKGLGEMDAGQLRETTMDPRLRTLRRITVGAAEAAEEVFDLLMGSDVAPRKEFIVAGQGLNRDRIDA